MNSAFWRSTSQPTLLRIKRGTWLTLLLPGQVRWRRIVLDEAHSIKDRRCSTARAVFALTSKYKWALSGTPLQACPLSQSLLSAKSMCTPHLVKVCQPVSR